MEEDYYWKFHDLDDLYLSRHNRNTIRLRNIANQSTEEREIARGERHVGLVWPDFVQERREEARNPLGFKWELANHKLSLPERYHYLHWLLDRTKFARSANNNNNKEEINKISHRTKCKCLVHFGSWSQCRLFF